MKASKTKSSNKFLAKMAVSDGCSTVDGWDGIGQPGGVRYGVTYGTNNDIN